MNWQNGSNSSQFEDRNAMTENKSVSSLQTLIRRCKVPAADEGKLNQAIHAKSHLPLCTLDLVASMNGQCTRKF